MVKKFTINCGVAGNNTPVNFYIGSPSDQSHPINFQMRWLESKGGSVPQELVDSFVNLQKISIEHRVPFENLCLQVDKENEELNRVINERRRLNQKMSIKKNDKNE